MILLLTPHRLNTDFLFIESLHVEKTAKGIMLDNRELDGSEIRKHFADLPKPARDSLSHFSKASLLTIRQAISKAEATGAAEEEKQAFRKKAILRKLHEQLLQLKPFFDLVKWHHKVKQENGNFKTSPCIFSTFRPSLRFEAVMEEGRPALHCQIDINNSIYPLTSFQRSQFLLESRNEYFLLTWKDVQTLEWLSQQHLPADRESFSVEILARLQGDYPVDTRQLMDNEQLQSKPIPRVMLSEISNSFLVLTPQWSYDGFIIEGNYQPSAEIQQQGKTYTLLRDEEAENMLRQHLESLHPNFARQLNGYFYLSFADAQKKQWFARVYHQLLDMGIEVAGMDMLQHFRYTSEKIVTEVQVQEEQQDMLVLTVDIRFGKEKVSLNELQKILWAGQKAVLLKDGSLGIIPEEWMAQYGPLIKHGKIQKQQVRIGKWIMLGGELDQRQQVLKDDWWKRWKKWQQPDGGSLYALPAGIKVEALRPYQQKGYEWMRLLAEAGAGGCLADDMGLGKTLQTICFLASRMAAAPEARHLVVCPSSLLYNWQQELNRFAPTLPVQIYHGPTRQPELLNEPGGRILITSYGTLRSDMGPLSQIHFDTIVADESHTIKNPASLTAKAVYSLSAATRIALSGTPVMNNTFDLYGQFEFMLPEMLGSREFFKREYADPIDRNNDPEKIKSLQLLTAPFILRRTKEQVAPDLPEKMESILWCEMGSDQREAYESIKENIRSNLFIEIGSKGLASGKLSVLHGIMKLRQACNSCELVKGEDLFTYESVKTQVLIEELKNITLTSRALVFSQFTSMLDLLERDLTQAGIRSFRLDGSTAPELRQQQVNQFNTDPNSPRVFLLSLKAGNAGLNLTAADYVFLFDPWWNRAVEQQAIDRTHRIGQTKNVFAYRMLCRNSIEEKILTLQERKAQLSHELITGDDAGFVQNLTEEDLAFLFS
ncbi:MAG: DEAD/DEAH box helicase family protein [Chitinophagaceae bacterium]|nr:DEAD/DEAH box helicase family protein [Chitinophagaceae bacterium]